MHTAKQDAAALISSLPDDARLAKKAARGTLP